MLVRIKYLALHTWVKHLHAVSLQCLQQDFVGHLESVVQIDQVLVCLRELFLWHILERAVEIVYAFKKVLGEPLESEVLSCLYLALRLFLQVAILCDLSL